MEMKTDGPERLAALETMRAEGEAQYRETEARMADLKARGRERSATFRLYYFAADRDNPKVENLAVREAIGEAFLNGIQADGTYLGIDEGVQFEVADGVLEATIDLTWQETLPEKAVEAFTDPEASTEPMEILKQTMEVS